MKKLNLDVSQNNVICGDCKDWLPYVPKESVDLIYIDPPFFSNRNYEIIWGNGFELRSFGDRWKGGIEHYMKWMKERLIKAYGCLKPTGSFFLHCDYRANYLLRILLNEIFGEKNFRNEIIWDYKKVSNSKSKKFLRAHDTIFFYSKTSNYNFNRLFETKVSKRKKQLIKQGYNTKNMNGKKYLYVYDEKKTQNMNKDKFDYIKNVNITAGNAYTDVFKIDFLNSNSKEKVGYKTQKPGALVKRIIECCTKENDVVLDFFGGGGTTAKVAYDLGRNFIIGDVSPVACQVIKEEMLKKRANCHNFIDCNPYLTQDEWRLKNGHYFAGKICEYMGWVVNTKKTHDGCMDGWANDTKSIPVQIKNSDVKLPTIREVAGVWNAHKYKSGIVVGWSFSKKCHEFVSFLERQSKIKIELKPADEIVKPIGFIDRKLWQKLYKERVKEMKAQQKLSKESA